MKRASAAFKFPKFQMRFSQLRGDKTQAEFAKDLGLSRPTVGLYESGKRVPDALTLKRIAEKCDVSVDYLLGETDIESRDLDTRRICELTGLSEATVKGLISIRSNTNYCPLVKRLRMRAHLFKQINQMENCIMDEAADAIEELEAELAELKGEANERHMGL